ncbi:MAG: CNNM domain-containing protein [Paracoccus sp. (in: a-proteobacteria)]
MLLEIAIVLALILLNGLLAMSELAIVSARPARLKLRIERGDRGAAVAAELAAEPGRFLSTVQIGITLVGVLSGAFSGATLGLRVGAMLKDAGLSAALAEPLGVALVVIIITYLSLIVGELVPKQVALADPEAVAARMAPAMRLLSRIAMPLVWLLDRSGRLLLALIGQSGPRGSTVSDEEIRMIIAEAEGFEDVTSYVMGPCSMCHAREPFHEGIYHAPKGVFLETPGDIARAAREIYLQAGVTDALPPANVSFIEEGERDAIIRWYRAATGTKLAAN